MKRFLLFISILAISISCLRADGFKIEEAQRTLAERVYVATGQVIEWPAKKDGTLAGQYPDDGFYADDLNDVGFCVGLVQNLYDNYVAVPAYYLDSSDPDISKSQVCLPQKGVPFATYATSEDYLEYFKKLQKAICLLKHLIRNGTQVGGPSTVQVQTNWELSCLEDECLKMNFVPLSYSIKNLDEHCNVTGTTTYSIYSQPSDLSIRVESSKASTPFVIPYYVDATRTKSPGSKVKCDLRRITSGKAIAYSRYKIPPMDGNGDNSFPTPFSTPPGILAKLGALYPLNSSQATSPEFKNCGFEPKDFPDFNHHNGWYIPGIFSDAVGINDTIAWVICSPNFKYQIENCQGEECQSCKSCETGGSNAQVQGNDNSLGSYGVGLGKSDDGKHSLGLSMNFNQPGLDNYSPSQLSFHGGSSGIPITTSQGILRQVKAPQLSADIVPVTSSKYQIKLYNASQTSADTNSSGLYTFSGNPTRTWTIENPNADTNNFNSVKITEVVGSKSTISQFDWLLDTNGTKNVTLTTGNGLKKEISASIIDATANTRTETHTILNQSGTPAYKEINYFQTFSWGEEIVQRVVDPDGAKLTTQWSYIESGPDGNHHLQQLIYPNGYWERYEYDGSGQVIKTVAQYLDCPVGSDESLCRVTSTIYSSSNPPVTIIESVLGKEVSRRYITHPATNEDHDIKAHIAGAAFDDPLNEVTITKYLLGTQFEGNVQSVKRPDGTLTIYDYSMSGNQKTTTIKTGKPNADDSDVTDGTKTVTLEDQYGNMISEQSYDIFSGLQLSSAAATQKDEFGRPTRVDYSDGTYTTTVYGCCGIDSSRDREGITTSYIYDSLKRPSTVSRAGISTTTTYDAAGNVLKVVEKGTDNTSITTNTSTYDLAGRLKTSKDALSKQTSFSEVIDGNGHTVRTTTLPNGKTEIRTFFKDGQLLSLTGSAAHPLSYEYGVEADGLFTKEYRVNTGNVKTEWTKTYYDFLGRPWKKLNADNTFRTMAYNNLGQLKQQTDEDGVITLYGYNLKGELQYEAIDSNRNTKIDFGTDMITRTTRDVITDHGVTVRRTAIAQYYKTGSTTATTVQTDEVSADGLQSWSTSYGLTTSRQTTYDGNGGRTEVTTAPDGTVTTVKFQNGLPTSSVTLNAGTGVLSSLSFGYDGHRRQNSITDLRTGTTSIVYDSVGRKTSVTTPAPDDSHSPQTTSFKYDSVGSVTNITLPDGGTVKYSYASTGELLTQSGTRTYTTKMTYDGIGRLSTLVAGSGTTTWKYQPDRGFLKQKLYADGKGPNYTYTPAGRLKTRTWARANGLTTYSYDNNGMLQTIDYADASTPDVTYTYDRIGRRTKLTGTVETVDLSYNNAGELLTEKHTGGPLNGIVTTNSYDSLLRRTKIQYTAPGLVSAYGYKYDTASRLSTVTAGTNSVVYGYVPNSSLVQKLTYKTGSSTKMTTTKDYDNLNRLKSISSVPSADSARSFSYVYNDANQRTKVTLADGSYWIYQYDSLGQVTSGKKFFSDNSLVPGQSFEYTFDAIGNRLTETENSNPSRTSVYSPNNLNQYTQRTVPGFTDVMGTAKPDSTVTVNNQPTTRHGDYFHKELSANNSAGPVLQPVDIVGVKNNAGAGGEDAVTETKGNRFLAKTPEVYSYDLDGNLTQDGRWIYTWDAENRLTSMESIASIPASAKKRLEFVYDYLGRRIQKKSYNWNSTTSVFDLQTSNLSVYDGWNCIGILNSDFSILNSFVWGTDLSGSMRGAGGVGGTLIVSDFVLHTSAFLAMDGNGNVSGLVDSLTGKISADYAYSPFGETIQQSGSMAKANPIRFSSKHSDDESGMVYYGYRSLNPNTGRWLSREPLGEVGSYNVYSFINNRPIRSIDILGLHEWGGHYYTEYIASRIANKSVNESMSLAFYSQLPDQLQETTAFSWFENSMYEAAINSIDKYHPIFKQFDDIQRYLHSLDGGLAEPRRDCLRKLLKDKSLNPWERGMISHAFGDAYAHSYIDNDPYIIDAYGFQNNPNYGKEVLYEAPIGHGFDSAMGNNPDIIHDRLNLYSRYVSDLVQTLNDGPLSQAQNRLLSDYTNSVIMDSKFNEGDGLNEAQRLRQYSENVFGLPDYAYHPEEHPATTRDKFGNPGYFIPTDEDVKKLIEKIKRHCCIE